MALDDEIRLVRTAIETDAARITPWPATNGSVAGYFDTPPPALPWFVTDRLLANRAHLLAGIGGTSKTTLLYHLAIGAIIGRLPWGWQIARTGSAMLLLAEDDCSNVHRVIANHARLAGYTPAEQQLIAEQLTVFPMAGESCRLLGAVPGSPLFETDQGRGLFDKARSIPNLCFIGLDPALALTEGDEMNPTHQRRLGEYADRLALETNACVVVTAHAAKASSNADELGSHTSRGSGAITDAVRGELVLRTMTTAEAKRFGIADIAERRSHVQLAMTKSNAAPPGAFVPIWLRRGEGGLLREVDLVETDAPRLGNRELRALQLLRELSAISSCHIKDWRAACDTESLLGSGTPDAKQKAMQRICTQLLNAGEIVSGIGRGVYLPNPEGDNQTGHATAPGGHGHPL